MTDDEIVDAMRYCFARLKLVVEPSGAVSLAALLGGAVKAAGKRIAIVVSGGNIGPADFAAHLTKPSSDFGGGRP